MQRWYLGAVSRWFLVFGPAEPTSAVLGHNRRRCIDFSFIHRCCSYGASPLHRGYVHTRRPSFWYKNLNTAPREIQIFWLSLATRSKNRIVIPVDKKIAVIILYLVRFRAAFSLLCFDGKRKDIPSCLIEITPVLVQKIFLFLLIAM